MYDLIAFLSAYKPSLYSIRALRFSDSGSHACIANNTLLIFATDLSAENFK